MNYYQRYVRQIQTKGDDANARGMATKATYNKVFSFFPGQTWRRHLDNPAIGFIEGLQFIGALEDKEAIQVVAPHAKLELFGPTSFYGPRTAGQFERAISDLKNDPYTRRAIVMIAHPGDTLNTLPCTVAMQFHRPCGEANVCMTVTMRSSDAVWGLPYDMIQFGMVHMAVAQAAGCLPGGATINIGNAHVYVDHAGDGTWWEEQFSMPILKTWAQYRDWARDLVAQHPTRNDLISLFQLQKV